MYKEEQISFLDFCDLFLCFITTNILVKESIFLVFGRCSGMESNWPISYLYVRGGGVNKVSKTANYRGV